MLKKLLSLPTVTPEEQINILLSLQIDPSKGISKKKEIEIADKVGKAYDYFYTLEEGVGWHLPPSFPHPNNFPLSVAQLIVQFCLTPRYLQESYLEGVEYEVGASIQSNPYNGFLAPDSLVEWDMDPSFLLCAEDISFWHNIKLTPDLFRHAPIDDYLVGALADTPIDKWLSISEDSTHFPQAAKLAQVIRDNFEEIKEILPPEKFLSVILMLGDFKLLNDYIASIAPEKVTRYLTSKDIDLLDLYEPITVFGKSLNPYALGVLLLDSIRQELLSTDERLIYWIEAMISQYVNSSPNFVYVEPLQDILIYSISKRFPGIDKVEFSLESLEDNVSLLQSALDSMKSIVDYGGTYKIWNLNPSSTTCCSEDAEKTSVHTVLNLLANILDNGVTTISLEEIQKVLDENRNLLHKDEVKLYLESLLRKKGKYSKTNLNKALNLLHTTILTYTEIIEQV